jgi:hypothetical protein
VVLSNDYYGDNRFTATVSKGKARQFEAEAFSCTSSPPAPAPTAPPAPVPPSAALDSDGDHVPDDRDACPDEKENYNGVDDEDGCPEFPHSRDLIRRYDDVERRVSGPDRPANCPVFRRVKGEYFCYSPKK